MYAAAAPMTMLYHVHDTDTAKWLKESSTHGRTPCSTLVMAAISASHMQWSEQGVLMVVMQLGQWSLVVLQRGH